MSQFVYLLSDSIYRTTHTNSAKNGCFLAENVDLATARVNTKKGSENYYNMFTLDKASARPLEGEHFDFNGYKGKMRLAFNTLALDFDAKDDIPKAFDDVKRFITDFSLENYQLFYSGSKGFHLYIHTSQLPALPEESDLLNKYIEKACDKLKETYSTLDSGIYTSVRKFRSPLSKHPKTGAYKIFCSVTQPLEAIQLNATTAQNLGSWMAPSIAPPNSLLNAVFEQAIGELGEVEEYNEWMNDHLSTPTEDPLEELSFARRFNSEPKKACIEALLTASLKSGERHEAFLRVVWALIHQGLSDQEVTKIVTPFMQKNNLEERQWELRRAFDEKRSNRPKFYQCKDKVLTAHCRSSCNVFDFLSAETKAARTHAIIEDVGSTAAVESDAKSKSFSEYLISKALLDKYGSRILKQDRDIFIYNGTHWDHYNPKQAADKIMKEIDDLSNRKLKFKDLSSCYNRFLMRVPSPPKGVDMFQPNPFRMNFKNGCLHIDLQSDGKYLLSVHPHKLTDYLMVCHKFDFDDSAPEAKEFTECLHRIWKDDSDVEAKIKAYEEVLGASLIAVFRKIVLFVGKPRSGKSTLINFATKLVHSDYISRIDPSEFFGFNLHGLAGKLVNVDTDINLTRPLKDSIIKKVEDRMPVRIQRKGISDIYAPIPAIHLYGANGMPKSEDGVEAYERRMIIFKCDGKGIGDDYIQDYANHVWERCESWIVASAIKGLKRLCENGGRFTITDSSRAEMKEWRENNRDSVEEWLSDLDLEPRVEIITDESSSMMLDFRGPVKFKHVWAAYVEWIKKGTLSVHVVRDVKTKHALFKRLRKMDMRVKIIGGYDYFDALSKQPMPESGKVPSEVDKSEF